jgi:hypothetical protein
VWTPDRKQIVASLATKAEGATTQSERYARTQCLVMRPDDLPTVHAKHRVKTAAHAARLAENAAKLARLDRELQDDAGSAFLTPITAVLDDEVDSGRTKASLIIL